MDSESQLIEQPTQPPAGDADSLAVLGPANEPVILSDWEERKRGTEERWKRRKQALLAKYEALDSKLNIYGDSIALTIDQAIPTLAEMEAFLSRKGRNKLGGIADELKLMNFPKWGEYLISYAEKYGLSARSLQRRLHEFRGEKGSESHPKRDTPKVKDESGDDFIARLVAANQQRQEKGNNKRQEMVPVIQETLASQLCKEGAHLARMVKNPHVSRETLIKMADAYLVKLHGGNTEKKKPVGSEDAEAAEETA
jgi:hypothetical protein